MKKQVKTLVRDKYRGKGRPRNIDYVKIEVITFDNQKLKGVAEV
jgi:hypothetical protein